MSAVEAELVIDTLPVPRASMDDLLRSRDRALDLFRQALVLLAEAEEEARAAAPFEPHAGMVYKTLDRNLYGLTSGAASRDWLQELMDGARKNLDYWAWTSLQRLSGLRNLMDEKATKDFREQLEKQAPVFSIENITATYMQLSIDAPLIFERSVLNTFRRFKNTHHKTNSSFRVNERAIFTNMIKGTGVYGGFGYYGQREEIQDLERVFYVLDQKKPPESSNGADIIVAALQRNELTADTPYFSVRMFPGNGNIHLKFKRLDLVDKVNAIIAKHANGGLPDDTKRSW